MDSNIVISVLMIFSGIYTCLCAIPKTGRRLIPEVYKNGYSIYFRCFSLFTGVYVVAVALVSIYIYPLFG